MKIRLSLLCIALTLLAINVADAQHGGLLHGGGIHGGGNLLGGGSVRSGFQQVSGNLLSQREGGRPGRLWFSANYADQGLGYTGGYLSLGFKNRIFQDRLDGRWLFEGRVHHSIEEDGGFFANVGLERVFSLKAAGADVSTGFWFDYDGDEQTAFSHKFYQVGISGSIKTEKWDLMANGYIPVGVQDNVYGDPSGVNCFFGNDIVMQHGIDSALQGFDVTLRLRPKQLAFANGRLDLGGYHYNSDLVNAFGGGRVRVGFQALRGMMVNLEVNHDNRFNTTGVVGIGWIFGANAGGFGSEYSLVGRDLESTVRNDHIVRFNQDIILATDPDTGAAYNVIHADNNADAGVGDGSAETPFATLREAQVASAPGDVIYVHGGDGTDRNYSDGIVLQDDQFLFGSGGNPLIPIAGGQFFELCSTPGPTATISNSGGAEVVRLASNNVVTGLTIDASGAQFGIRGIGRAVNGGIIAGNTISGAAQSGVELFAVSGNWDFSGNTISQNGDDGIFVAGGLDPTSIWNFEDNVLNNNGIDGLHLRNYDGAEVNIVSNVTNSNGRHGLFLENNIDVDGPTGLTNPPIGSGIDVDILGHTADANGSNGIVVSGGDGNLRILNTTANNNPGVGLLVSNWTDTQGSDRTIIGATEGGSTRFSGNGTGLSFQLDGTNLVQDVLISGIQSDLNGRGLFASSKGTGTVLNLDIIDNISFASNENEAIRMLVDNGGTINNVTTNTEGQLNLTGNSGNGGGTITYVLSGPSGVPASVINSEVSNVNIFTAGGGLSGIGINVESVENSRINLDVSDSSVTANVAISIDLDNENNNQINTTYFDNLIIRGDGSNGFGGGGAGGAAVFGQSRNGTLWDFSLTNSNVQSNGSLTDPFGDTLGDYGIYIAATGGGAPPGQNFDNLTRVNIVNNVVRDFTFDGITIESFGDAQLLANLSANQILNNGPGVDDDPDDDGFFEGPNSDAVATDQGFFHDGLVLRANGISTLTARLSNNAMLANFEQGLTMQTTGSGTINATLDSNRFANDTGIDTTPSPPGPINFTNQDMNVLNSANGNICVGMTNNTLSLGVPFFINANIPTSLGVGLDGASNGFSNADLPGFVTPVGFGLCDNLILAEELFFANSGNFSQSNH